MFDLTPSFCIAFATSTSGRKLDIVCSVQPYGYEVRNSSAANTVPAIDGVTLIVSLRVPDSAPGGYVNCCTVSLVPGPAIEPDFDIASFTPNGTTGSVSSIASLSTSVSALPSTRAEPTLSTRTR